MPASFTRRLLNAPLNRLALALGVRMERARGSIGRASLPRFASPAPGLVLQLPFELRNPDRIHLGHDVKLGPNCILKATTSYPGGWLRHPDGDHVEQTFEPRLHIGDRVTATSALQVVVYDRVTIEEDVIFAANVYISDANHAITRGDRPYKFQGIERPAPVLIERGAWIGQNVVIMPGVTIGAFTVVGANAVVTGDIPSGTVAVGAPARVVRRWDAASETWRPADDADAGGIGSEESRP